jgi:hypothetical protein
MASVPPEGELASPLRLNTVSGAMHDEAPADGAAFSLEWP